MRAVFARDGYAAVPTTPRENIGLEGQTIVQSVKSGANAWTSPTPVAQHEHAVGSSGPQPAAPPKVQSCCIHTVLPQLCKPISIYAKPISTLRKSPAALSHKHITKLQVDHLRLTPVRRVRDPQRERKYQSPRTASLYAASNVRTESHPGPGQYHVDRDSQLKRQDFRRPHDPVSASFPSDRNV